VKLIIQIPAFDEASTLPATLADLPRRVPGFDLVEFLVIDDGSTDDTAAVARICGADHVLELGANLGLAAAFKAGLEASLALGADVIVNTDADNQYVGADVARLVGPILQGRARIVIGARPIGDIAAFSPTKKLLQRLGSWVVRRASGTAIPDAPSGFRAYHRDAAARLCVLDTYSYTLETIIQAGRVKIPMLAVPVRVNPKTRQSRLMRSIPQYVLRSARTILRISVVYNPLRFFLALAAIVALPAMIGVGRFLAFYAAGDGNGHVQSLVLSGALLAIAMILGAVGVLAHLIAVNRNILQDIRARQILGLRPAPRLAPMRAVERLGAEP
jgi:glycosyltransferase involved in cell wall biosynthesis